MKRLFEFLLPIREALKRWGTPEPIALKDREPHHIDLDENGYCWWWDRIDDVWEQMNGNARGLITIEKFNTTLDTHHYYTHWLPHWAIKIPKVRK